MKYMLTFYWKPDAKTRDEGIARLQPPEGAKLLGRWTRADFTGGYDLVESDDPQALAKFALVWSDLVELTIDPVIEDEQLSDGLQHRNR